MDAAAAALHRKAADHRALSKDQFAAVGNKGTSGIQSGTPAFHPTADDTVYNNSGTENRHGIDDGSAGSRGVRTQRIPSQIQRDCLVHGEDDILGIVPVHDDGIVILRRCNLRLKGIA